MTDKNKVVALRKGATDGRTTRTAREVDTSGGRIPWNGGLKEDELLRPGGALMAALLHRANEKGHQLQTMSDELNVTYGYIAQLRGGFRLPENISDAFVDAAALYLDQPRMTVLMLCGRVTPDDVMRQKHNVAEQIPAAVEFIARDPVYGPLMPLEVVKCSYEMQFFIISLYERATGKVLLDGRQDPKELAVMLAEALAHRTELLGKVEKHREDKAQANRGLKKKSA